MRDDEHARGAGSSRRRSSTVPVGGKIWAVLRGRPEPANDLDEVLEDERHADRGDQRAPAAGRSGAAGRRPARSGRRASPMTRHRDGEASTSAARGCSSGTGRRWPGAGRDDVEQEDQADERADHEHVAVGEVDQLDDPVDHRVAEGDEGVDRADRQRVDDCCGPIAATQDGPSAAMDRRRSPSRSRPRTPGPRRTGWTGRREASRRCGHGCSLVRGRRSLRWSEAGDRADAPGFSAGVIAGLSLRRSRSA